MNEMTISDALLYDAEWWITDGMLAVNQYVAIDILRKEYGRNDAAYEDISVESESFFILLIREAIKDE